MRIKRNKIGLIICALLLLTGCNSRSGQGLPPNEFSQRYSPLQVDTLGGLREIDAWEIMGKGETISSLQYNHALNRLTLISEQTGRIILFLIGKGEVTSRQIIDIPNLQVLGIDKEGGKLLVGNPGQALNEQGELREYFNWIAIWNIASGSLDECFSGSCVGRLTDPDKIENADIGAVMDAETAVMYDEYSYRYALLSSKDGGGISLVNSPDAEYWWHIGRIALNTRHNKLAVAYAEGRIEIEKLFGSEIWPLKGVEILAQGDENHLQSVQNAVIDPSDNWLAIVRGKQLSIWKISGWIKNQTFHDQIDVVRGISFNPPGDLLFIAINDHIRIIGLKENEVVLEIQTPGIASLSISDDNRLIFWGDENGTAHVWAIP